MSSIPSLPAQGSTAWYPHYSGLDAVARGLDDRALRVLVYANGSYPSRPSGVAAGCVRYVGPSQPTDWLSGDEWVNNA